MDPDVKILKVTQTTEPDAHGRAVAMLSYTFNVATHDPFSESFPKLNFDPAAATAAIAAFAMKLKQTLGTAY